MESRRGVRAFAVRAAGARRRTPDRDGTQPAAGRDGNSSFYHTTASVTKKFVWGGLSRTLARRSARSLPGFPQPTAKLAFPLSLTTRSPPHLFASRDLSTSCRQTAGVAFTASVGLKNVHAHC